MGGGATVVAGGRGAELLERGDALVVRAAAGMAAAPGARVPWGRGFAGRVAAERRALTLDDAQAAGADGPLLQAPGVHALLGAPLVVEGRLLGVLLVGVRRAGRFAARDGRLLQVVADRAALAIDRARLEAAERRARADALAAEAALRQREEFLSVAAHELRTPVAALRAAAQLAARRLAREGAARPERLAPALATATAQAGKLARLIDQLLDLSRLEGGRLALERELTDLAALAGRAVAEARARAEGRAVRLVAPTALEAWVDPLRVEQVLVNLLDNALKYAPDGPIEVALARRGGAAELAVRDHGPGVPPERRGRLFERYYRAHEGERGGGLGVGLYLSRAIAERHGGALRADFPPEGGARFVLTLPLAAEAAGSA